MLTVVCDALVMFLAICAGTIAGLFATFLGLFLVILTIELWRTFSDGGDAC